MTEVSGEGGGGEVKDRERKSSNCLEILHNK